MDPVLRAAAVYFFLLIVIRASGRRTLSEMTTFDFILVLIIGEAVQQALLGQDFSITHAAIVTLTLLIIDIVFSLVATKSKRIDRTVEGLPVVVVERRM